MSKWISIATTIALLGGLISCPNTKASPLAAMPAEKDPFETRVYTRRQCLLGEKSVLPKPTVPTTLAEREAVAALVAIFAPILIGKAIAGVAAALRKAGEDKVRKDSGRLATYLYQLSKDRKLALNPDFKCVIVVRGIFDPGGDPPVPQITFPQSGIFTTEDQTKRIARLRANGILVSRIATAYEAQIKLADDETAFLYESKFFEMSEFQDKSAGTRAVVISIAINGAGQKEGEPTLSLVLINLGETKQTVLGPDKLTYKSSWVGGLGINAASLKFIETITSKPPSDSDPPFLGIVPVTVEAVLTETEDGNKALKFIADVLDASNEKVTEALTAEITKDGDKAAETAATALEKLQQEEEATYAAFLEALAENTTGLTSEQVEVIRFKRLTTKRAWCLKFNALKTMGNAPPRAHACP